MRLLLFTLLTLLLVFPVSADTAEPAAICTPSEEKIAHKFFVAPDGNDANSGRKKEPFATLERARSAVRAVRCNMRKDITVYLRGGSYYRAKPFVLTEADSGMNGFNVRYAAFKSETPAVNSGYSITGWQQLPDSPLWKAAVTVDDVQQLYTNGTWQPRARSGFIRPQRWYLKGNLTVEGLTFDASGFPMPWKPESVMLRLRQEWRDFHLPIDQIANTPAGDKVNVVLEQPYFNDAMALQGPDFALPRLESPMFLENDLAFIDSAGEWYFDSATREIYYLPPMGIRPNEAVMMSAVGNELLRVEATSPDLRVENLQFYGIHWYYAGNWRALAKEGMSTIQAHWLKRPAKPVQTAYAAITVNYANNITFENNFIRQVGTVGLWAAKGVTKLKLKGNVFTDLGDSAIVIGHPENEADNHLPSADPRNHIWGVKITNNLISNVSKHHWSSPGISVYYAARVTIKHNDLFFMPYSGISLGWGWTLPNNLLYSNKIINNRIEWTMRLLSDGGAIYTLGYSGGAVIRGNVIADQLNEKGAIYLDEGSANWLVEHNIVQRAPHWLYIWQASIRDNVIRDNWTDSPNLVNSGTNNTITDTSLFNIFSEDPAFVAINEKAGLKPAFQHLLVHRAAPSFLGSAALGDKLPASPAKQPFFEDAPLTTPPEGVFFQ